MGQIIREAHPKGRFCNSQLFPVLYLHVILRAFSDAALCIFCFNFHKDSEPSHSLLMPSGPECCPCYEAHHLPAAPVLGGHLLGLAGPTTVGSSLTWGMMACCTDDLF